MAHTLEPLDKGRLTAQTPFLERGKMVRMVRQKKFDRVLMLLIVTGFICAISVFESQTLFLDLILGRIK